MRAFLDSMKEKLRLQRSWGQVHHVILTTPNVSQPLHSCSVMSRGIPSLSVQLSLSPSQQGLPPTSLVLVSAVPGPRRRWLNLGMVWHPKGLLWGLMRCLKCCRLLFCSKKCLTEKASRNGGIYWVASQGRRSGLQKQGISSGKCWKSFLL